jgi:hypothetical protein
MELFLDVNTALQIVALSALLWAAFVNRGHVLLTVFASVYLTLTFFYFDQYLSYDSLSHVEQAALWRTFYFVRAVLYSLLAVLAAGELWRTRSRVLQAVAFVWALSVILVSLDLHHDPLVLGFVSYPWGYFVPRLLLMVPIIIAFTWWRRSWLARGLLIYSLLQVLLDVIVANQIYLVDLEQYGEQVERLAVQVRPLIFSLLLCCLLLHVWGGYLEIAWRRVRRFHVARRVVATARIDNQKPVAFSGLGGSPGSIFGDWLLELLLDPSISASETFTFEQLEAAGEINFTRFHDLMQVLNITPKMNKSEPHYPRQQVIDKIRTRQKTN